MSYYEQIIENLAREISNLRNDQKDYQLDLDWLLLPFKQSLVRLSRGPPIYNYTSNQPIPVYVPDSVMRSKEAAFGVPNPGMESEGNLKRSKILRQENELKESRFSDHNKEIAAKGSYSIYMGGGGGA